MNRSFRSLFQALERHGVGVTKPDSSGIGAFDSSISTRTAHQVAGQSR